MKTFAANTERADSQQLRKWNRLPDIRSDKISPKGASAFIYFTFRRRQHPHHVTSPFAPFCGSFHFPFVIFLIYPRIRCVISHVRQSSATNARFQRPKSSVRGARENPDVMLVAECERKTNKKKTSLTDSWVFPRNDTSYSHRG